MYITALKGKFTTGGTSTHLRFESYYNGTVVWRIWPITSWMVSKCYCIQCTCTPIYTIIILVLSHIHVHYTWGDGKKERKTLLRQAPEANENEKWVALGGIWTNIYNNYTSAKPYTLHMRRWKERKKERQAPEANENEK